MSIITKFKSLPLSSRRLLSLGIIVALFVALPLFIWGIVTQTFNFGNKAQVVQRYNINIFGSPTLGPSDAPIIIVEFSDFQCPFCKQFATDTFQQLLQAYPDKIKFVFKNYPITAAHPLAEVAAEAGMCANEQNKFWEMHDLIFINQESLSVENLKTYASQLGLDTTQFNDCLDSSKYASKIQEDITDGNGVGVNSTPSFFIDGIPLVGAQPLSAFQQIIDSELLPSPTPTESANPSGSPTEAPTASPSGTPGPTAPPLAQIILNDQFIDGVVGEGYRNFFYGEESGYTTDPTLTLNATNLPAGFSIPPALCGTSYPINREVDTKRIECALDGIPQAPGTFQIHVTLSDDKGHTISKDVPLNILAASATATPTPTETPTPVPGTPNPCNGTCGSNYNCEGGLYCYQGFCRNPFCPTDSACGCSSTTPTPTSIARKSTPKPTGQIVYLTPRPSHTPGGFTLNPNAPTPTAIAVVQAKTQPANNYLLWIAGGSFTTAVILVLFAL